MCSAPSTSYIATEVTREEGVEVGGAGWLVRGAVAGVAAAVAVVVVFGVVVVVVVVLTIVVVSTDALSFSLLFLSLLLVVVVVVVELEWVGVGVAGRSSPLPAAVDVGVIFDGGVVLFFLDDAFLFPASRLWGTAAGPVGGDV